MASSFDKSDIKIKNMSDKISTLETQIRVLTGNVQNLVREFNKMKNDMGAMRKKHKSDFQSLASRIK